MEAAQMARRRLDQDVGTMPSIGPIGGPGRVEPPGHVESRAIGRRPARVVRVQHAREYEALGRDVAGARASGEASENRIGQAMGVALDQRGHALTAGPGGGT